MATNKAVAVFKALKVFSHDGIEYGIGNALALEAHEAEELVQTGKLQLVRYLDMDDARDRAEFDRIKADPKSFKAAKVAAPATEVEAETEEVAEAADTGPVKPTERMKRPELEALARAEAISGEDIAGATSKEALIELINEHRKAVDAE